MTRGNGALRVTAPRAAAYENALARALRSTRWRHRLRGAKAGVSDPPWPSLASMIAVLAPVALPATVSGVCERGDLRYFRISNAIPISGYDLAAFLEAQRART